VRPVSVATLTGLACRTVSCIRRAIAFLLKYGGLAAVSRIAGKVGGDTTR